MYEDDKYKVTIDVTDYEWKELLHMCIDLHMSPDALATAFCKEVIRQQALLRIIAAALEEKYDGMLDDIRSGEAARPYLSKSEPSWACRSRRFP